MASLACIVSGGGSSAGDEDVSCVKRGGRGGWGELPHGWLWFLGSGLLNC